MQLTDSFKLKRHSPPIKVNCGNFGRSLSSYEHELGRHNHVPDASSHRCIEMVATISHVVITLPRARQESQGELTYKKPQRKVLDEKTRRYLLGDALLHFSGGLSCPIAEA